MSKSRPPLALDLAVVVLSCALLFYNIQLALLVMAGYGLCVFVVGVVIAVSKGYTKL